MNNNDLINITKAEVKSKCDFCLQGLSFLHEIILSLSSIPNIEANSTSLPNPSSFSSDLVINKLFSLLENLKKFLNVHTSFIIQKLPDYLVRLIIFSDKSIYNLPVTFFDQIYIHLNPKSLCEFYGLDFDLLYSSDINDIFNQTHFKIEFVCKANDENITETYIYNKFIEKLENLINKGNLTNYHILSMPCKAGNEIYGYLGCIPYVKKNKNYSKNNNLISIDKTMMQMLTIISNYLGFWFSYIFQITVIDYKRDIQRKVNMTLSVLLSSVNIDEIISKLISDLNYLFGQKSGAIILTSSNSNDLEIFKVFGTIPNGIDINRLLLSSEIKNCLLEGEAYCPSISENPYVKMVFPFVTTAQHTSFLQEPEQISKILLGGIVIFRNRENSPLSPELIDLLSNLINGVSASLLVAINYLEKLETIRSLEGLIGKLSNADELFSEMIEIIKRILKVTRISFLTFDDNKQYLVIRNCYGLPKGVKENTKIAVGEEISGWVVQTGKSLRIDNIETDLSFRKRSLEGYFNKSLLSVPLIKKYSDGKQEVLGVINVNNKISGLTFTEQDQRLLEAIAQLVVATLDAIQNEEMRRKKEQEEQKMQLQLSLAREVQIRLLPKTFHNIPSNLKMYGLSVPAIQIGGDLYDGILLKDGRWLVAIADVSGKGMAAAILMAITRIILRTVVNETSDLNDILKRVNSKLSEEITEGFVTMQLVAIDANTGMTEMVSAGHGPLLHISSTSVSKVETNKGMPLGIVPDQNFEITSFCLKPNDTIILFTDGVYEEKNQEGEMFGFDRLCRSLYFSQNKSPEQIVENIFADVKNWRKDLNQHDDITVVAVKFLS